MPVAIIGINTLEYYLNVSYETCPRRKFLGFYKGKHIAIDNLTGEFFMEEFEDMQDALDWLKQNS